jgi:predicted transcriptional regulator
MPDRPRRTPAARTSAPGAKKPALPRAATSDAERTVLKALWEHGPGTVREVQQHLAAGGQRWTRSTVITLLQRLEKKGYLACDRAGFAYVFRAAVSLDEVLHERMSELAAELSAGEGLPLVLAFTRRHRFTPDELREFRRLIDEADREQGKNRSAKDSR